MKNYKLSVYGQELSDLLTGFIIFILVSAPSLKFFFFTSVWNVLSVLLISVVFILRRGKILKQDGIAIYLFVILFTFLILSAILSLFRHLSLEAFIKYIVLLIITLSLPLFINLKSIRNGLFLVCCWGVFLAVLRLLGRITLNRELGQTYLTLGLPIALAILISFYYLFFSKRTFIKVLNLIVILLCYKSLFTLLGRAPVLFSSTVIILYLLFISLNRVRYLSIKKIALLVIPLIVIIFAFNNIIPSGLKHRIINLGHSLNEENRIELVYKPAFKAIKSNPIGYGLDSTFDIIGNYPHNIFLEILLSAGIPGFLSFLLIVILFIHAGFDFFKQKTIILAFTFITLYLFFVWNVSFNLSSAYALLPFIASIITLHRNKNMLMQ